MSGVAESTLQRIKAGRKTRIRQQKERSILRVRPCDRAPGVAVPAAATWRRVSALLEEGYTRGTLARLLGARRPALQLGRNWVKRATALRVERLYRRATSVEFEP